jgi:pimeloyl-ACP methyl ester carboxylesterase
MADPPTGLLHGRVMDSSDNWLPDVRIRLLRLGLETRTDGNGMFQLPVPVDLLEPAPSGGPWDQAELVKEGHRGRVIALDSRPDFDLPVTWIMEPDPVGADNPRFTVVMPRSASIHGIIRKEKLEAPHAVSVTALRENLDQIRERPPADNQEARFYGWAPPGIEHLRAVFLISLHGMGSIDHPVLRRFAAENAVALVGVEGQPVQRGCYPVELLDAPLERLGIELGHPGLATLPVFTFGHSNGTGFATVYAVDRADRLIGWISYHSGHAWQLLLPGVEHAPGLVLHGHLDRWLENGQEAAVKSLRRERNAPVGMMLEGNVGHGPVDTKATWEFIVAFCEAVMRTRLTPEGTLRPVVVEEGWLGGVYDRSIGGQQDLPVAPFASFDGDRESANWLPDAAFAETWRVYGKTDPRVNRE